MARRDDDFIVDDDGFGYKDKGGEIWEVNEGAAADAAKNKKKRKLNVSLNLLCFFSGARFSSPVLIFSCSCLIERRTTNYRVYVPSKWRCAQQTKGCTPWQWQKGPKSRRSLVQEHHG